jgi:CubicO group peptidase (beta-lactamase class C family)
LGLARVVNDPAARNSFLTEGSFGWSGAFGTHFWVDRKEKLVAIDDANVESRVSERLQNMVMQAVVDWRATGRSAADERAERSSAASHCDSPDLRSFARSQRLDVGGA